MNKDKRQWALQWLSSPKRNYIGGEWHEIVSKRTLQTLNPSTEEPLFELPLSGAAEVDVAVQKAKAAFESGYWRRLSLRDRALKMREIGAAIKKHEAELATLETLSNGKLYRESLYDDLPDCSEVFTYYAGWIDKLYGDTCPVEDGFLNYTLKEPLGVCALIVPWNFPLLLACWKMAPALATGNAIIVKPSEYTSTSLIRAIEIIDEEVDLPQGLINLVLGDGETGDLLASHPEVAKVSFTGSTEVGKKIVHRSADSNLKSLSLELGGKSPVLFFADTPDLEGAVERSFQVMFSHKGEKCTEPTRFVIERSVYPKVLEWVVQKAEAIRCGDPFEETSTQGAQCYREHYENILEYIEVGKSEGARLAFGGAADRGVNEKGFFIRPTIFADVKNSMRIAQEEIFGPVLCLIPFDSEAEAIEIANDTSYGLAAGLYTGEVSRAHRVAAKIDAGMVFVNHYGCYSFSSPFGGFKQSGWGKEMAKHSLESFTKTKSIWVKVESDR